jgi:hypothetical protein
MGYQAGMPLKLNSIIPGHACSTENYLNCQINLLYHQQNQ